MKLLKFIFKALLIGIVALGIIGFFLPSESNVSRSIEINDTPEKVFGYINDLRQFTRWSPWTNIDPDMVTEYSGAEKGVGARLAWRSDHPHVGNGTQEIILSSAPNSLVVHLEFDDQGGGDADFLLQPTNKGTKMTWRFHTDWGYNIVGRYMGLMMDKWVGPMYAKGLDNLKQLAESEQTTD